MGRGCLVLVVRDVDGERVFGIYTAGGCHALISIQSQLQSETLELGPFLVAPSHFHLHPGESVDILVSSQFVRK